MKILFVTNHDWFFISHRLNLAIYAINKGYEVYLVSIDTGKAEYLESLGIKVISISFNPAGKNPFVEIKNIINLSRLYRIIKPDIIHHITLKVSILGSIAAKLSGCKNVINAISGLGYTFTGEKNGIFQKIVKFTMNFAFNCKHFSFILQNPEDFEIIKKIDYVPSKSIYLIKGSGVNLNQYTYTEPIIKDKLYVLFPARILRDKGVIEFIDSAKKNRNKLLNKVIFILAGDCNSTNPSALKPNELLPLLEKDYIEWVGFQENMLELYKKSDIVVLPSYREGLPKSLIEACAVGRPIITTNVPGCKECVDDSVNGYLVPSKDTNLLSDKILELIENENLRLKFGQNSRVKAENEFSVEIVTNKTFEIYTTMMAN